MKMRAAVLRQIRLPAPYARSRPLSIEEVELAPPGPGEVRLKIHAAGLCHSDLSAINAYRPWPMPIVVGHEAAGEVIELSPGTTGVAVGDHAVLIFRPACGACPSCAVGRPARCEPGAARSTLPARRWAAIGGWRCRRAVRSVIVWAARRLPNRGRVAPLDREDQSAAALGRSGAVWMWGAHRRGRSLQHRAPRRAPRRAAVGWGGVGFASLMAASAIGARYLVTVDLLESKLRLARELGATAA